MTSRVDVKHVAQEFGLSDLPIEVHASLRSFGHLDGGPAAVVDGLLDTGATVLVPTFTTAYYGVAEPLDRPELRFERNATAELARYTWTVPAPVYNAETLLINANMGAVPASVLAHDDHVRGDHALNSFSAVGPLAEDLISGQTSADVYAPLRRLVELNGYVVMMGVGLDKMTLIHYAELVAGRNLFRRWVSDPHGHPVVVKIGSCSNGFENFTPFLRDVERVITVGESNWRVFRAADVVNIASRAIREQPKITRCGSPECARCLDAVRGGPIPYSFPSK